MDAADNLILALACAAGAAVMALLRRGRRRWLQRNRMSQALRRAVLQATGT